ncbi:hypothetical protein IQ251_00135 [Saccharopolyspora sp. HNM0983]|uniref:Uncharacterized protein n=1 Tax=Saccharopolyspora montiporae TaxID=2781240 RepID=A0A929FZS1_9PSEU|nr:hypothetical protein [Saccharopolyspora sp. HNM0983]MBE9372848.1 hypothetical protein [Saccharopolyspora sp. HNM0983]
MPSTVRALTRATTVATCAAALAVGLTGVGQAQQMGQARFTVQLFESPNLSAPLIGTIHEGNSYQTFEVVQGQAIPPHYCGTDNPGTDWRPVLLPDGKIGYTSIYCIF